MRVVVWILITIIALILIAVITPNLLYTFAMVMFFIYGFILAKIQGMNKKPKKPKEDVKKDGVNESEKPKEQIQPGKRKEEAEG